MYLDQYKIEGATNLDEHECFAKKDTYETFQEDLGAFKSLIDYLMGNKMCATFYKFGDGDYYFLKRKPMGSAQPGKRALSKFYTEIKHEEFVSGAQLNDYYTCELYPENIERFTQVIEKPIAFPAEFTYGLVANKWLTENFKGKIGLIGADKKLDIIKQLMSYDQYREYLGLNYFNDYIKIPQRFACDSIDATEKMVAEQLKDSSSEIFLLGIGHVKSALTHRLKKYKTAVYLDVGASIDALAGMIDIGRPFFGDWTNFHLPDAKIYEKVDLLAYSGEGKTVKL